MVFQNSYKAMISVMTKIIPSLPNTEKYDLVDQLRRACKAVPRLIAEGYAKRHQKAGFRKYLDDAMAECNETIVSLETVRDVYSAYTDITLCKDLIVTYEMTGRQLYKLAIAWTQFGKERK